MDVVTLTLAKKSAKAYTDKVIDDIGRGISYRGAVNYYDDLPQDAEIGDCYSVLYEGTSGTTPSGAEYIWGKVNDSDTAEWIKLGEEIDLTDYIKNTDYASTTKGGVIKLGNSFGMGANGAVAAAVKTYAQYQSLGNYDFIGKGTLENVLNATIGDINSALDIINGEIV